METPVHEVATSNGCEIQMLTRPSQRVQRLCNVRLHMQQENYWSHLPHQGGWLFSLLGTEPLSILCPTLPDQQIEISGAGVLQLSANCVARTRTTTLTGTRAYDQREQFIYQPKIPLIALTLAPGLIDNENFTEVIPFTPATPAVEARDVMKEWEAHEHGASLYDIERKIKEIGSHRREKAQQHTMLYAGYMAQGVLVVVALLYIWRATIIQKIVPACVTRHLRRGSTLAARQNETIELVVTSPTSPRVPKFADASPETKQSATVTEQSSTMKRGIATLPEQTARTD